MDGFGGGGRGVDGGVSEKSDQNNRDSHVGGTINGELWKMVPLLDFYS